MKNYISATGQYLSWAYPPGFTIYYYARYTVLIYFIFMVCGEIVHGGDSIIHKTGYGSYGIITRIQSSSKRVIFQPMDGAFNEGFEVSYYDLEGQVICKGIIKSIYKDEIYTSAEDCEKFDKIGPGMGVAFNGDISDMLEIYKNREKLEAFIIDREWNRSPGVPKDIIEDLYDKMVIRSSIPVLVEFYATWCPYCQETVPVLGEIAKDLEGQIRVVTIDKEKNAKLCTEMKVKGVPAFFIVRDGKVIADWTGAIRDKQNVVNYIKTTLNKK